VFQRFRKAKSANGGSILSSSQFLQLPQWPLKMTLAIKVVKVDSKIIISIRFSFISVKQTECVPANSAHGLQTDRAQ
jgi:hypothetical protein